MRFLRTKIQIATFIALLFHLSGIIAIGFFKSQLFIDLTPLNLIVSLVLILWTQEKITSGFLAFLLLSISIGFCSEWIGIHTGYLFGHYRYGNVLGPTLQEVPWIIGINWFITIYAIGIIMSMLQNRLRIRQPIASSNFGKYSMDLSLIVDGAALAVFFDWVMEPVAVRLGYWHWKEGVIPALNYWSWFGISGLILLIFRLLRFQKHNLFAVHLLLIQLMFFLIGHLVVR